MTRYYRIAVTTALFGALALPAFAQTTPAVTAPAVAADTAPKTADATATTEAPKAAKTTKHHVHKAAVKKTPAATKTTAPATEK